jgi:hypothetical protein
MKTSEEIRKLAKSKFDNKYRYNDAVKGNAMSWSIWKVAFDAGYSACAEDVVATFFNSNVL